MPPRNRSHRESSPAVDQRVSRITSETIVVSVRSRRLGRSLVEKEEYRTASRTAISFIDGDVSGKNENCRGECAMHIPGNVNRRAGNNGSLGP